jgi:hypothetical protein
MPDVDAAETQALHTKALQTGFNTQATTHTHFDLMSLAMKRKICLKKKKMITENVIKRIERN